MRHRNTLLLGRIAAALGFGSYIVIGTISLISNCIPFWYYLLYVTLLPTGIFGAWKSDSHDEWFLVLGGLGLIVAIRTWFLTLTCYS